MIPSPNELTYFLEVCQTLNFSRAAERLGLTQPSLSQSIKKLEDTVGSQLFVRSKNGVTLTHSGEKLRIHSQAILDDWNKLKSNMLKGEQEICGQFIIGCHTAVANYTIPYFMPLINKEKDLEIHFEHGLSRIITEKVISHKIDIGLVINPVKHPDLVIRQLAEDNVGFWVHKSLKIDKSTPLIFDPALGQCTSLLKKIKKSHFKFSRFIHSSDLEVIRSLTEAKSGIGILPKRVATSRKGHQLKLLVPEFPQFRDSLCLIYRADNPKTKAFNFIVSTLVKALQQI